jgi:hypothetical protein
VSTAGSLIIQCLLCFTLYMTEGTISSRHVKQTYTFI